MIVSGYQLLFEAEVVKGCAVSRLNSTWAQTREALRQVVITYGQAVEAMVEAIGRLGISCAEAGKDPPA